MQPFGDADSLAYALVGIGTICPGLSPTPGPRHVSELLIPTRALVIRLLSEARLEMGPDSAACTS